MAKVGVTRTGPRVEAIIEGSIDEQVDLESLIGPVSGSLRVSCGGIARFNSIGVKNWIQYFGELKKKAVVLEFVECSPAVVEMCNSYHNFLAGGRLFSLHIPFLCGKCQANFVKTATVEQLKERKFALVAEPCPKCGASAEFDDLPEAFFGFLTG